MDLALLGIESSLAYVREPAGTRVAEKNQPH